MKNYKTAADHAAYWKKWRQKNRPYVLLICPECGSEYGAHRDSKRCPECRKIACVTCGKKFDPCRRTGYQSGKYCQPSCKPSSVKGTPEYRAWVAMIQRCYSTNHPSFENYGGRGITVCNRWRQSFNDFLSDVGRRPELLLDTGKSAYSLDRFPNNNGNYEPGNVRWATQEQQNRNRRDNVLVTIQQRTMCISEWAIGYGISPSTAVNRIRSLGWEPVKALTTPVAWRSKRVRTLSPCEN